MSAVTAKQAARILLAAELRGLAADLENVTVVGEPIVLFKSCPTKRLRKTPTRSVVWPINVGRNKPGIHGPYSSSYTARDPDLIRINGSTGSLRHSPVAMLAAGVMLGPHRKVDEMVTPIMFVRQLRAWMTTHSRSSKLPTDVDLTTITVAAARRAAEHTGRAAGQWLRAEAALVGLEP